MDTTDRTAALSHAYATAWRVTNAYMSTFGLKRVGLTGPSNPTLITGASSATENVLFLSSKV